MFRVELENKHEVIAHISGVDIPDKKRGEIALTYIYGIGRSTSQKILKQAEISYDKKAGEWNDAESSAIRSIIGAEFKVEGALRSEVQLSIKRLMDIGCYRGLRHRKGLPLRGQRTKNNSRTRKDQTMTFETQKADDDNVVDEEVLHMRKLLKTSLADLDLS
ncbi:hypothetical protein B566_EDAN018933, partial [Ephemera danica]